MRTLVVGVMTLCTLSLSACASDAKFCDKMREIYGDSQDDCESDAVVEVKGRCKNAKEVMSCVIKAEDRESADKCIEVCEAKDAE